MPNSRRYSSVYNKKKRKGSSRLVKKEEKKLHRQTALYVFLGVIFLILFVFLIVPNLIKFFFAIFDADSPFEEKDEVPPQTPVLSAALPEATYSAELSLAGFAEPESSVIFVLNSEEIAQVEVDEAGNFKQEINLNDGENELILYGLDEAGNESLKTRSYQIIQDGEAPFLDITTPENGASIELKKNRNTPISGQTEPLARVYLNGRLIFADSEGNFSSSFYLEEGENTLKFEAVDKAGNKTSKEIQVKFRL